MSHETLLWEMIHGQTQQPIVTAEIRSPLQRLYDCAAARCPNDRSKNISLRRGGSGISTHAFPLHARAKGGTQDRRYGRY